MILQCYDRSGHLISADRWMALTQDLTYVCVNNSVVVCDAGAWEVSTIWLGLTEIVGFALGFETPGFTVPPAIFETMTFQVDADGARNLVDPRMPDEDHGDWRCRYSTVAAAEVGHADLVAAIVHRYPDAVVRHLRPPDAVDTENVRSGDT